MSNFSLDEEMEETKTWPPRSVIRDALKDYVPTELTEGPEVDFLEVAALEVLGGPKDFIACSGGTQAIEIALRTVGVGPGDTVVVPAFTFIGSVIPVIATGAKVALADVDPRTFNVTPETVRAACNGTPDVVLPVHLHGLMADVPGIRERMTDSWIVEDACQAFGASINGVLPGEAGHAAAWSLNHKKTVFAGEGGLVGVQDEEARQRALHLRFFGMDPETHVADVIGSNWKLPEISARIARFSLRSLPERVSAAARSAAALSDALDGIDWLAAPHVPPGAVHVYHKYRVMITDPDVSLDQAMDSLAEAGVPVTRWGTAPIHLHPAYAPYVERIQAPLTVSEMIPERTFIIGTERDPLCAWDDFDGMERADRLAEVKL